jgi:hypothetical protein
MQRARLPHSQVSWSLIWMAMVLLLGVLLLGVGHFQHNTSAFYAGALVTLAGVLNGVLQRVVRRDR